MSRLGDGTPTRGRPIQTTGGWHPGADVQLDLSHLEMDAQDEGTRRYKRGRAVEPRNGIPDAAPYAWNPGRRTSRMVVSAAQILAELGPGE